MAEIRRKGDLEIAGDPRTQHIGWIIERIGWAAMAAFVAAGLLGLFGSGPLAHGTAGDAATLQVSYPRFCRFEAPLELHFRATPSRGAVALWIDRRNMARMAVTGIDPEPTESVVEADRLIYRFAVGEGPSPVEIVFRLKPDEAGSIACRAGVVGGTAVSFDSLVYP